MDRSFGTGGVASLAGLSGITEVTPTTDGRIVVLGGSIVRLDSNGSRDSSFGSNGTAVLPAAFSAQRLAIGPSGTIALLGTTTRSDGSTAVAVARLSPDGRPDLTFGTGGVTVLAQTTDPEGDPLSSVMPGGLAIRRDGSIVATMLAEAKTRLYPDVTPPVSLVETITPAGTVDTSFGDQGEVLVAVIWETIGAFDPLVTKSGTILLPIMAVSGLSLAVPEIYSISGDGKTTSGMPRILLDAPIGPLLALPDGGYLVLSDFYNSDARGLNLSYLARGDLFRSNPPIGFKEGVALPGGATDPRSLIAIEPDGKIVIAGSSIGANGQEAVFVARLLGVSRAIVGLPRQRLLRSDRTVRVRLSCSPAQLCHGTATLSITHGHRHNVLGSSKFTVPAGRSAQVTILLTRSGRARLAGPRASHATLTLDPENGPIRVAQVVVPRP
jgi:uncharacterized delta-60 repeat protein